MTLPCIYLFLGSILGCLQDNCILKTGISDFHKLVLTALTTHFKKQEPKTVKYRNYEKLTMKNFDVSY